MRQINTVITVFAQNGPGDPSITHLRTTMFIFFAVFEKQVRLNVNTATPAVRHNPFIPPGKTVVEK